MADRCTALPKVIRRIVLERKWLQRQLAERKRRRTRVLLDVCSWIEKKLKLRLDQTQIEQRLNGRVNIKGDDVHDFENLTHASSVTSYILACSSCQTYLY